MTETEKATVQAEISDESRIRLRPLAIRRDMDGWVIGRIETGDFVSVPDIAHRVVTLLGDGRTIQEISAVLRAETGTSFDVAAFVATFDELGFVDVIDGAGRPDANLIRPSFPWLRPGHVRWLLHPIMPFVVGTAATSAAVVMVLRPALVPSYRMLVWNGHAGMVLAVNAAIAWTIILLHESAHLAAARAAGVPGRMTLSTRLQFLTAQTDVSGIWAAPRRIRLTVYLAGTSAEICCVAICTLIHALTGVHGLTGNLLSLVTTLSIFSLPLEFMVFMRTDIYFVLQDLSGCSDLYADGSRYLRYVGRRALGAVNHQPDPTLAYPSTRRWAVRTYSVVLLVGTAACLAVEFAVSLPALVILVIRAVSEMETTIAATADGSVALAVLLVWQFLWASRWWHRHRHQVRSFARRYLRPSQGR
jgi:putative peptide zinc metalloprotease protein